jgi:peptidyl-prolyl cis-trans isomerase B (cyclophilin B)
MNRIFSITLWIMLYLGFSCSSKEKDYIVTIHTRYGDIEVVLYDQTPEHKKNFLDLAQSGKYDSIVFHRVIDDFMIQGGDLATRPGSLEQAEHTLPAEIVPEYFHHYGALAAARQGDNVNPERRSSGSQFYIVEGTVATAEQLTLDMQKLNAYLPRLAEVPGRESLLDTLRSIYFAQGEKAYTEKIMELVPAIEQRFGIDLQKTYPDERLKAYTTIGGTWHLDDAYTVFGRVVSGMDVVRKIASVQTMPGDRPAEPVYMTMEVEEVSKKRIAALPDIYSVQ